MEQNDRVFVAMDMHKETIAVAVGAPGRLGEVRFLGEIPNRADAVRRLIEKLASKYGRLSVCYEAGPCGDSLHRQMTELGRECVGAGWPISVSSIRLSRSFCRS
ncbi:hypothetical protein [Azospirillum canadense]|uniref:hypothetical protein n=1 Tax=Azospirillum canadense TaxID=403962 RepID=UPI002227F685|nr:hypothetical protein [Azospirillum canadense]MCW2239198.1 hypothetical protein [Azospirillum canadense]